MIPRPTPHRQSRRVSLWVLGSLFALSSILAHAADKKTFDVPAGTAPASLKLFAEQAGGHVLYSVEDVRGVATRAVKGKYTAREALDFMLMGTALHIDSDPKTQALTVRKETEAETKNVSRAIAEASARPDRKGRIEETADGEKVVKLDTFEVFAGRTLNMDLPRTRNDIQPYVVFDRQAIERSGAFTVEDFIKQRLPMDGGYLSPVQYVSGTPPSSSSRISLRGLSLNETLILIDGRRAASSQIVNLFEQPDVNGIPVSAIERIEVLPSTASGIYGGGRNCRCGKYCSPSGFCWG